MPKFRIHTTWEIRGWTDYEVEADDEAAACAKFEAGLPAEAQVDGGDSGEDEDIDSIEVVS